MNMHFCAPTNVPIFNTRLVERGGIEIGSKALNARAGGDENARRRKSRAPTIERENEQAMSGQHEFDEEEAKRLEAIYTTPSASARRQLVRDRLDLETGETVVSIGCGPGFEPAELAEAVGETGRVLGVDVSEAMLGLAENQCAELPQVTLKQGDAVDLPVQDGRFDAAVSVQVFDYIEELGQAVAELGRSLRPGGRAAVYSTDWDNFVWHSSDPARMDRVIDAWTDVYANPHLGSKLATHFDDAGLTVETVEPNSILNTDLDETFAGFVIDLFRGHIEEDDRFDSAEIEAWERDLRDLDEAGETFFNLTQYLYIVRKPEQ